MILPLRHTYRLFLVLQDLQVKFLEELFKNRNRLEINDNIFSGKYFNRTVKVTSKQFLLSDNIVDDIIRTLHDNPYKVTLDHQKC